MKDLNLMQELLISFGTAVAIALVAISILKRSAKSLGLLDIPNARKVHARPIPVIGGLAIGITLMISLVFNPSYFVAIGNFTVLLGASLTLLAMGILDDKLDLKPSHRLLIQLGCAYLVAHYGIRLTSLYGIFGIYELNIVASYAFTVLLIVGVVNAFNLIDGIDGLAGFLALVGFGSYTVLAYMLGNPALILIMATLIGGVCAFLFHNLRKKKVFLGDGGSLFIGFLLVSTGIYIIQMASTSPTVSVNTTISIVFGVFLIPVLDSLRVYYARMKKGFSPFSADKTHIHHLLLSYNLNHKQASGIIAVSALALIALVFVSYLLYGITTAILSISLVYLVVSNFGSAVKELGDWKQKLTELENQ